MPAPIIKNQHYVPQSYQKLFSDTGKSKMVYAFRPHDERGPSKVKHISIKSIGSKEYFYEISDTFKELSGSKNQFNELENTAFPYENGPLVQIIMEFEQAKTLTPENTDRLLKLAFDLKRRNPSFLDGNHGYNAAAQIDATLQSFMHGYKNKYPSGHSFINNIESEIRPRLEKLKHEPNLNGSFSRGFGFTDESNEGETKALKEIRKSTIIRNKTDATYPFISSDNPGFTWSKAGGVHTTGFGFWEEYTFVASPRSALVSIRDTPTPFFKLGLYDMITPKSLVDEINSQTCANCLKYVYGGNEAHVNLVRDQLIHLMKSKDLPNGVFENGRSW